MDAGIQQLLCHLFELISITALLLEELGILAKIYLKFIQIGQEERLAPCTLLLKIFLLIIFGVVKFQRQMITFPKYIVLQKMPILSLATQEEE